MIAVIDTSALLRLFVPDGPIPEGLESFMLGVERGENMALAPELILAESANVLNKKRILREITEKESRELLTAVLAMPIRTFRHGPLLVAAFDIARQYKSTVHDALYIALALHQGAKVFSADQQLLKIVAAVGI